ncbi:CBM96 family carbohydrate-binding protein [Sphingobacterium chuzhouense]|uniref:DNRLRE domain-containing protein n=1 Tax=Sphingobacterium chuzhouense TaxID=1742264 RepID=A0ABR7XRB5_9SPHI|nr:DNRLRE domain-containing protein [Sphingobacterium chuzhouense]MBD1421700.1 DNRLRE domain-containing protein [Sphingobacterium chuzhouense]
MQTKIILNRFLTACITITLLMTSCEIQENFKYEPSGVDGILGVTAWSFIQANDDFDQLERAIIRTGLQNLYQEEERTFIIPNNKAFSTYLESSSYSTIEDIPLPILRNMLRYHIVKDRVIFTDPTIGRDQPLPYETENGQTMFLSRNNNYVGLINQGTTRQWEIRTSNLEPTNGVIHAVDFIVYFSAPAIDNSEDPTLVRDTIYPLADSFVAGNSAGEIYENTNYGTNPLLRPKYSSPALNSAYDRFAYLMFDLDDFEKPGIVVDVKLRLAVSFTTGDGYMLNLFKAANNNWSESTITFKNAPGKIGDRISYVTTSKVNAFNFDITNFYKNESPSGRVSFMLESGAAPAGNKTDDLASKEHATLDPPMIIATLATNQNVLVVKTNEPVAVSSGGSTVIHTDLLELSGADAADIIYTVKTAPQKGWLIRGADIIGQNGEFVQTDLQSLSLLYIHDGESTGEDTMILSARDRTGAEIEDIEVKINIQ